MARNTTIAPNTIKAGKPIHWGKSIQSRIKMEMKAPIRRIGL